MKMTASKQKSGSKTDPNVIGAGDAAPVSEEQLDFIATAAYFKAEARGFAPGKELDDWLEAEAKFSSKQEH